ncbi:hypothetical protein ABIF69_002381 [Bradyrhizobium japonicum]
MPATFDFRRAGGIKAETAPQAARRSDLIDHVRRLRKPASNRLSQVACVAHRLAVILRQAARISSGGDMKVNIEIDCTPLEARQFFGLPDVSPMQTAVMDKLQQQVLSNIEKVSPESLIQSWFTFDPKIAERFQDMFVTMAGLGSPRSGDKKK